MPVEVTVLGLPPSPCFSAAFTQNLPFPICSPPGANSPKIHNGSAPDFHWQGINFVSQEVSKELCPMLIYLSLQSDYERC